jgi:aspartate/glutamate racemase
METVVSDERDLKRAQADIFRVKEAKGGHDRDILQDELAGIGRGLIQKGARAIVIGCTELSLIRPPKNFPAPVFDALTILAWTGVKEGGSNHPHSLNFRMTCNPVFGRLTGYPVNKVEIIILKFT